MKLPDVLVSNDAAWMALEAIDYSKKVIEALLKQNYENKEKDFYYDSGMRCINLCEKARALWAKERRNERYR